MKIGLQRQNTLMICPSAIGREIDLDRRAGGDGRGVRDSSARSAAPGPRRRRPRRRRRWRCRENRGACAPPKTRSSRLSPSPPAGLVIRPRLEPQDCKSRGGGADRSRQSWERQDGASVAFYWHPCGASASPLSRRKPKSRISRSSRAVSTHRAGQIRQAATPCGSPFTSRTFPRTPARFCALCACLGLEAHIIEPAGFPVTDRAFRRAGMDYLDQVAHRAATRPGRPSRTGGGAERLRLVLFTTAGRPLLSRPRLSATTTSCCSAAKAPACRRRCIEAADAGCASRCAEGLRSLNVAMAVRDGRRRGAAADGRICR